MFRRLVNKPVMPLWTFGGCPFPIFLISACVCSIIADIDNRAVLQGYIKREIVAFIDVSIIVIFRRNLTGDGLGFRSRLVGFGRLLACILYVLNQFRNFVNQFLCFYAVCARLCEQGNDFVIMFFQFRFFWSQVILVCRGIEQFLA